MIRKITIVIAALIGGFVAGVVISEATAIVAYFGFGQLEWLRGLKALPFIGAAAGAAAAWIWVPTGDKGGRRRSGAAKR